MMSPRFMFASSDARHPKKKPMTIAAASRLSQRCDLLHIFHAFITDANRKGRLFVRSFFTLPPICAQNAARMSESRLGSQARRLETPLRAARRRASTFPTAVVGSTGFVKPSGRLTPTGGAQRHTMKATSTSTEGLRRVDPLHDRKFVNIRVEWDSAAAEDDGMEHIIADATVIKGSRRAGQTLVVSKGDALMVGVTVWMPLDVRTWTPGAAACDTDGRLPGSMGGTAVPLTVCAAAGVCCCECTWVWVGARPYCVDCRSPLIPLTPISSVFPAVEVWGDRWGRQRRSMVAMGL
jgi:hypothetical protein